MPDEPREPVGTAAPIPGSGNPPPEGETGTGWDQPNNEPAGGEPPASPPDGGTPAPVTDGGTPPATPPAAAPPSLPEGALSAEEATRLRADMQTFRQMAEHYQGQLNQFQQPQGTPPPVTPAGAAEGAPPPSFFDSIPIPPIDLSKLPPGVKPPNQWENQEDVHRFQEYAQQHRLTAMSKGIGEAMGKEMDRIYQSVLLPQFKRIGSVIQALEQGFVKAQHKDFDEVTKEALGEMFVMDPSGNVVGIKNPALVRYIRESPMPSMALYNYALSRRAPKAIADATRAGAKTVIDGLDRKPKPPTKPPSTGAPAVSGDLDWDTPPETADAILRKRGIIV